MMDMNCSEIEKQLSAYLDQELGEAERRAVAEHVSSCQECLGKLKAMQNASLMVKSLGQLDVPAELSGRLRQIASAEPRKDSAKGRSGLRLPPLPYLVGAGAVAAVALVVLLAQVLSFSSQPQQKMAKVEQTQEYGDGSAAEKGAARDKAALPKTPDSENDELLLRGLPEDAGQSAPAEQRTFKIEKDLPIVVGSTKNYRAAAADKLLENIKKKTSGVYTVADTKNQRDAIINKLVQKVSAIGGDGQLVAGPVKALLDSTKRPALPVYIEKAKFNGQDCLLIIISWGFGPADSPLDRASLHVTDLAGWSTVYYQSK